MNLKKTAISAALASMFATGASQAAVIDMNFDGLFTMLDPAGVVLQNTSYPYYGDTTWGYGKRTQISGTMQFDTESGYGTGTVVPFEFYNGGPAVASGIEFQSVGNGLMIGNMNFAWNSNSITTQIVLDGSGLFGAMGAGLPPVGAVLNQASCAGLPCATPASDAAKNLTDIGPAPIATSGYNVLGATGTTTTLGQLTLGALDSDGPGGSAVGGTPMDNGPFDGFNANFDITSLEITAVDDGVAEVPVPAAVWLFGSGLVGLAGVARRRKA